MAMYVLQLALNLAWSFLFFGGRMIGIALAAIGVNAALFWRADRLAGYLAKSQHPLLHMLCHSNGR